MQLLFFILILFPRINEVKYLLCNENFVKKSCCLRDVIPSSRFQKLSCNNKTNEVTAWGVSFPLLFLNFASQKTAFRFTSLSLHLFFATSGTLSQIGNSMQICSAECFASPYAKYVHSLNSGKMGIKLLLSQFHFFLQTNRVMF